MGRAGCDGCPSEEGGTHRVLSGAALGERCRCAAEPRNWADPGESGRPVVGRSALPSRVLEPIQAGSLGLRRCKDVGGASGAKGGEGAGEKHYLVTHRLGACDPCGDRPQLQILNRPRAQRQVEVIRQREREKEQGSSPVDLPFEEEDRGTPVLPLRAADWLRELRGRRASAFGKDAHG